MRQGIVQEHVRAWAHGGVHGGGRWSPSSSGSVEMPPQNKPPPGAHCAPCWQGVPHQQCHTDPGVWDGVSFPTLQPPELSLVLGKGWGVLAWLRDLTDLTEKQLPLWAQSMGHENTLVSHPHSHQGSQGWGNTTGLPSVLLGLASPLMWLCPPSLRWMRRPTSRTSSTASPLASGSR